jgi:hypothetical protein
MHHDQVGLILGIQDWFTIQSTLSYRALHNPHDFRQMQ